MSYKNVAYLNPDGSYSHLAAQAMCPGACFFGCGTFYGVVRSLLDGQTDAAVLPIENTINGGVLQNMDLLERYDELSAVRQYTLRVDHRLVTLAGADKSKINRIFSHRQALDQCSIFLRENFPDAEYVPVDSTSAGITCIKRATDAAIAGPQAAGGEYDVSGECISDEKNNFTYFLLIIKGRIPDGFKSERIYFCLTCDRHVPGALMHLLEIIYKHNLNMTKIESRPIKDKVGEYKFFIEIAADYSQKEVKTALDALKGATLSFRLIGCY